MDIQELNRYYNKLKYGEEIFHTLMQKRIREILLVSTFYDAYIFEQDGRLSERIFGEFHQLNLTYPPRIISVPTGEEALRKIDEGKIEFDLVITMMRTGEMTPFELSRKIKQKRPNLPVLLLLTGQSDIPLIEKTTKERRYVDNVFLWNGDPQVFLAMVKYIEDLMNVEHDTAKGLVRVVLLVEDSIYYYSRFLPILYKEIMLQTQRLISEELTDMQKNYRRHTRPKVLMAHTLEDAIQICEKYQEYLLSVISDIRFLNHGQPDPEAGIQLIHYLKSQNYDIPILLQSSETTLKQKARELNVSFLDKHSKSLLSDLSEFIYSNLGFGDFIFRDRAGNEIARASTIGEFEQRLQEIPDETLSYHSRRNHYSAWLIARGEIEVARYIRPFHVEDFGGSFDLEREFLIGVFREVRARKSRGNITSFDAGNPGGENEIVRLSEGSLGGKGRGIAFLNALFVTMEFEEKFQMEFEEKFQPVKIKIPRTAFIGTAEFDAFLKDNKLQEKIVEADDALIKRIFLEASLSASLQEKLAVYLEHATHPLAVRSSGLLEDSQAQAFAGIYQTFMLPNNHPSKDIRQKHLEDAVKMVYASAFLRDARNYIERIKYRTEEEKMTVILQEIVGSRHGNYFYPHVSGVAQSYNYYPTPYMNHHDGFASIALGLGQWVVDGEKTYQFCPQYPQLRILPPEDLAQNSQTAFFALNLRQQEFDLTRGASATLDTLPLDAAEQDGVLWYVASVWDEAAQRLRDGLYYDGPRVLTFANILKYKRFPLAEILTEILDIGEKALGAPVEIEFAVNLQKSLDEKILPTFYILQIRPLFIHSEELLLDVNDLDRDRLLLYTEEGMGNGVISHIRDLIYLDPQKFDHTHTLQMKAEIQQLNEQMLAEEREYILIGPGRWGSRDHSLGVPVRWADIHKAKVIVETSLDNFAIESSQGSHFFHNLVSMSAGYFTVPHKSDDNFIDWAWLKSLPVHHVTGYFVHVRRDAPFIVKMFGRKGISVIYK